MSVWVLLLPEILLLQSGGPLDFLLQKGQFLRRNVHGLRHDGCRSKALQTSCVGDWKSRLFESELEINRTNLLHQNIYLGQFGQDEKVLFILTPVSRQRSGPKKYGRNWNWFTLADCRQRDLPVLFLQSSDICSLFWKQRISTASIIADNCVFWDFFEA